MKTLIAIVLLAFSVNADAQTSDQNSPLPTSIITDFSTKFPDASALEWDIEDSVYTATFTLAGERHIINYNPSGTVLSHRYTLKEAQYPSIISIMIERDFNTYRIKSIDSVEQDGVITYDVKLKGEPNYKVVFDSAGRILSKREE